jgi:hypothetical protein
MTMGRSTWYRDRKGSLARVDVDDAGAHWTAGTDMAEILPALPCLGVHDIFAPNLGDPPWVGVIGQGAFQTGPNDVVLAVVVNRFSGVFQIDRTRRVHLDLASGAVTEMPVTFFSVPTTGAKIAYTGWRRYRIFDGDQWDILNLITEQEITKHQWADPVFAQPDGSTVGLPAGWTSIGVSNGRLYLRPPESEWAFRVFDLDNLVTDGQTYGDGADHQPPAGWDQIWTILTDPDRWLAGQPGAEIGRDLLEAVIAMAHRIGSSADVLLAVLNLESGLRTDAYHPAGRYGLLQLTAEELTAAGWTGTPEDYLCAQQEQLTPIGTHLAGLDVPADIDETGLWVCLHLTPPERTDLDLGTVLAAPGGPRPELYARYGVADVTRDNQLTVDDIRRYLRSKRHDARLTQLRDRADRLGAVVPRWTTLAEVTDGAARLGLSTVVVPVPNQPGFVPGQVVSTDPPAGSLTRLADAVEVRVSTAG